MRECRAQTFLKVNVSSFAGANGGPTLSAVCHGVKLLRRLTSRRVALLDRSYRYLRTGGIKPSEIIYHV